MDRLNLQHRGSRLYLTWLLSSCIGCVANPVKSPTIWDGLGIPQATAALRDATINRNGNFPKLEKKPPVLKLADPANLAAEKPEMIKAAAKIKTDQDLKKQKIKAIKYLAEVNCGCYNKDDAVAKAFLAALDDCDPEVRTAAVEGLSKAAGSCSTCRTGCETTCCTEAILKKLQDIATGKDAAGCYKEPVKEIRVAAAALVRKCPCPPVKPLEELPAPEPSELEELVTPELPIEGESPVNPKTPRREGEGANRGKNGTSARSVAYKLSDEGSLPGTEPVMVAKRGNRNAAETSEGIVNPDQLISVRLVRMNQHLGEVLVELNDVYQLSEGWTMVVVNSSGKHQLGRISEASGRRLLIALDSNESLEAEVGSGLRIGLVRK